MELSQNQILRAGASFSIDELKILFDFNNLSNNLSFSISCDSRTITKDQIFLPLIGERFDGHNFINTVLKRGVQCSFCERSKLRSVEEKYKEKLIIVESTLDAYHKLANYYRKKINPKVIAVTGSSGKTTVKDLIALVLSSKFKTHKTEANFNNEIGLAKTILEMPKETEILVLELAMRKRGEIRYLAKTAMPDVLVIASIGSAHIGRLGSIEEIIKAKTEAFEFLSKDGLAILCNEQSLVDYVKNMWHGETKVFDISDLKNIKFEDGQSIFSFRAETYKTLASGSVHALNSEIAILIGEYFGLNQSEIQKKLLDFKLPEGRGNVVRLENGTYLIDETYNASPDSVKVAVNNLLESWKDEYKKLLVLGELAELGEYEDKLLLELGSWLDTKPLTKIITIGDKLGKVSIALKKGIVKNVKDTNECCAILKELLSKKTVVLIKGSHVAALNKVIDSLKRNYG